MVKKEKVKSQITISLQFLHKSDKRVVYNIQYYLIKNAKVKVKSAVVNKIILYISCIMHQNFLKEARLGASFDSVGRLFHILTPL